MVPFDALFRYQKTFNESRFLNISLDKYNTNFKNLYTTNGNRYGNQIITVNVQNNKHLFHGLFISVEATRIIILKKFSVQCRCF